MNKKILIGSIIAVVILVVMSSSSAIYVNISGDNHPPDKPWIMCETDGKIGKVYTYTFRTEDQDGDNVSYYIKWGDGTSVNWTNYSGSGDGVELSHSWKIGGYIIRCKAKDIHGAESNWSDWSIDISKNKQIINPLFLQWLDRFPILNLLIMRLMEGWE